MIKRIFKENIFIIITGVIMVVMLDQLTKQWMVSLLPSFGESRTITSFFNLVMVKNNGVAFGFLQNSGVPQIAIMFFTAIVALFALIVFWQSGGVRLKVALSLALGGGLSNGIDRWLHGGVIDFLDFHYQNYHWPSFNVADMAISLAILLLLLEIILGDGMGGKVKKSNNKKKTKK